MRIWVCVVSVFISGCATFVLPEINYYAEFGKPKLAALSDVYLDKLLSEAGLVLVEMGTADIGGEFYYYTLEFEGSVECDPKVNFSHSADNRWFSFGIEYYAVSDTGCIGELERQGLSIFKEVYGVDMIKFVRHSGIFGP